jgi:hypothetical protein
MEERTKHQIAVREVTELRAAWTEEERGASGAFTIQLILDGGADEYVLRPTAEDAEVLLDLWKGGETVSFDLSRKVLIFGNIPQGIS